MALPVYEGLYEEVYSLRDRLLAGRATTDESITDLARVLEFLVYVYHQLALTSDAIRAAQNHVRQARDFGDTVASGSDKPDPHVVAQSQKYALEKMEEAQVALLRAKEALIDKPTVVSGAVEKPNSIHFPASVPEMADVKEEEVETSPLPMWLGESDPLLSKQLGFKTVPVAESVKAMHYWLVPGEEGQPARIEMLMEAVWDMVEVLVTLADAHRREAPFRSQGLLDLARRGRWTMQVLQRTSGVRPDYREALKEVEGGRTADTEKM